MPTIVPNSRTLLSVYPLDLEFRVWHNGLFLYNHPAAKKDVVIERTYNPNRMSTTEPGKVPASEPMFTDVETPCEMNAGYSLIKVYDTFTWHRDYSQDKEVQIARPIEALTVARELYRAWGLDVVEGNGGMGPGLLVIAGDKPTADELASVRRRQSEYFRKLIDSASMMFAKGEVKNISDLHRAGARWMGANNLPWVLKLEQVEMKSCKACGETIRTQALVCKECNTNLPKFYESLNILPDPLEDPVVFAFMDKSTAKPVTPKFPTKAA